MCKVSFSAIIKNMTIQDLENKYPKRDLPVGAEVFRASPSPTGFVHLGLIYAANINMRLAHNTKGVFILRIEDTDTAREIKGSKEQIVEKLAVFGIRYDEGLIVDSTPLPTSPQGGGESANALIQIGNYGPYIQSERKEIYDTCINHLISIGRAYRCYMSKEELDNLRSEQEANKVRPGVYGQYAKWRPENMITNNLSYPLNADGSIDETNCIIRFRSLGNEHNKFAFHDEFMGDMMVPENDEDLIIRKSDGLPTYHLAHVVDDHFMRVTFVMRGNEWWSSLGKHIELWQAFGWDIPKYGHILPINKQETLSLTSSSFEEGLLKKADEFGLAPLSESQRGAGGEGVKVTVRKLSKRKDPESDVQFFLNEGYMPESVLAYMTRLANPSFDDWMMARVKSGEKINLNEFDFNSKELARGGRGPLIDMNKLNNISSEYFSYLDNGELYNSVINWIQGSSFTPTLSDRVPPKALAVEQGEGGTQKFLQILENNKDYALRVLSIERRTKSGVPEKLRKDIYKLSQVEGQYYYFFDELYEEKRNSLQYEKGYPFSAAHAKELKLIFANNYIEKTKFALHDCFDSKTTIDHWLGDMKVISTYLGYDKFANFMRDLRLAITLEERTPNLYDVMQVMGRDRVLARLG